MELTFLRWTLKLTDSRDCLVPAVAIDAAGLRGGGCGAAAAASGAGLGGAGGSSGLQVDRCALRPNERSRHVTYCATGLQCAAGPSGSMMRSLSLR